MPPTSRRLVQNVRASTDLVELVGQYVTLHTKSGRHVGVCPFHLDSAENFTVSAEIGLYFCFVCKASGDALRFYENIKKCSPDEALRVLAERAGVEIPTVAPFTHDR